MGRPQPAPAKRRLFVLAGQEWIDHDERQIRYDASASEALPGIGHYVGECRDFYGRENLGTHKSGATFEALVTTLVFFEDPTAALFGRRGKDGGQDARSGDGTLVYQAKHHENGSAALAIKDALDEADKIEKYRAPSHRRHAQWKAVKRWRLVTNAVFNPTDRQVWDTKVVSRFAKLNLKIDYWERANLDGLLDKHPEVDRSFFQNEVRAFLSIPEVRERTSQEEPFLKRAATNEFVGRDEEVQNIRTLLKAKQRFMVVHGTGGIGKTRLLLEAGEEIAAENGWQVLWANVATLSATGTWFEAIVPERKTLLLVDEPEDSKALQVLAEQLGPRVGRTAQWKVVVAVRSQKDPVLKYLRGPRMKSQVCELIVNELNSNAAISMCRELLERIAQGDERERLANEISARFSRHPVWMTLAVHLLERHGNWAQVPHTSEELARAYLVEIVQEQCDVDPRVVEGTLRWTALVGPLNRENDGAVELIAQRTTKDPTALLALVAKLVNRRALIERGARRRLVEVKPDVLRDRLLLDWLTTDVGFGDQRLRPSTDAKTLANEVIEAMRTGNATGTNRAMLVSLARSELLLRLSGQTVELLGPVFDGIRQAADGISASHRIELVKTLESIAPFRPGLTVELARKLLVSACPIERRESAFGAREVGQDDVALTLAWLVSYAALGARDDEVSLVLETLCTLVNVEAEIQTRRRHLPNDGKRAAALLKRTFEGGPQFLSNYDAAARTIAHRVLTDVAASPPTESHRTLVEALLLPMVSIQRIQNWYSEMAFHWRRYVIGTGDEAWITRAEVIDCARALLQSNDVPAPSRLLLWKVIVEAHMSVNRSRLPVKGPHPMRSTLLGDLQWTRKTLTERTADLEELTAARPLWEWHFKCEKDPELKQEAIALEALYREDDVAGEFEQLLQRGDAAAMDQRAMRRAEELAAAGGSSIDDFLFRGLRFLGGPQEIRRLLGVAFQLGRLQLHAQVVRDFAKEALTEKNNTARLEFGVEILAGWIFSVRTSGSVPAVALIQEWLAASSTDLNRVALLTRIYQAYSPRHEWCSPDEERFLRAQAPLFVSVGQAVGFIQCVASSFEFDLPGYQDAIESVLHQLQGSELTHTLIVLIERMDREMLGTKATGEHTREATRWLFDQILRVPSLDDLGGNTKWHLEQLVKHGSRAPARWLLDALRRRKVMEEAEPESRLGGLGHSLNLGEFVETLQPGQESDEETLRVVDELLNLIHDAGSIGYKLPDILHELDPNGIIVPNAVAARVQQARGYEELWKVARLAESYVVGTVQWGTIAKAVIVASSTGVSEHERRSLFHQLGDPSPRSWSGTPGEVAPAFLSSVAEAKALQERETDDALRLYWDWYIAVAEASLRNEQERVKEERGE